MHLPSDSRAEPFFEGSEPVLIYIARRLKEALAVEEALNAQGLDYLVEPDRYVGGFLFRSERVGAFFYVHSDSADRGKAVLRESGYKPYTPEQE